MELVEIDPFKRISLKLPPRFGGGMRLRICCMVQAPFRSKRDRIPTRIPGHFGIVIVGVVICHLLISSQRFRGGFHILVFYLFFCIVTGSRSAPKSGQLWCCCIIQLGFGVLKKSAILGNSLCPSSNWISFMRNDEA